MAKKKAKEPATGELRPDQTGGFECNGCSAEFDVTNEKGKPDDGSFESRAVKHCPFCGSESLHQQF